MLIDSHCHLNMLDLELHDNSMGVVLDKAKALGVEKLLCVAVDLEHDAELKNLAETYDNVFISAGVHPSDTPGTALDYHRLKQQAQHNKVVAVGETGLDYHYNKGDLTWQRERFRQQIQLGRELHKPIIIHTRDAKEDTIQIMREEKIQECGAVMHCFTETWEMAQQAMDMGAYISFSGIVTFKNAKQLQEVAQKMPLHRMLVETDCPYLTPIPYRGKPNQPGYTRYVAEFIAELRNESFEQIAAQTTKNCEVLFGM